VTYEAYVDVDGIYTFDRVEAEVVQHIPILRENWVVSLRGEARTTIDDDDVVPFFLLPALGSGSTLRAFPSWRFRDRHSLLLSGEWRWIPNRMFLDMALFYDAGKVTGRREDLDLTNLVHDYGVGFRLHGPMATPLRIDVAHGREGINIVFSGAAPF
jgi:outer membrane protein assembly factor BamA